MIKYETHTNYELRMLGLLRSTGAICDNVNIILSYASNTRDVGALHYEIEYVSALKCVYLFR